MEGIRGFDKNMCATLGNGIYQYEANGIYREQECKARRNGFHFVEYAPDCLAYYGLGNGNRYFLIEAAGDINEEGSGICSCTQMTMIQELSLCQFAIKTMEYMVKNPRMDWERERWMLCIAKEQAKVEMPEAIAIARGKHPQVQGVKGSILGLVLENEQGDIIAAKAWKAENDGIYTIKEDNRLEAVDK